MIVDRPTAVASDGSHGSSDEPRATSRTTDRSTIATDRTTPGHGLATAVRTTLRLVMQTAVIVGMLGILCLVVFSFYASESAERSMQASECAKLNRQLIYVGKGGRYCLAYGGTRYTVPWNEAGYQERKDRAWAAMGRGIIGGWWDPIASTLGMTPSSDEPR